MFRLRPRVRGVTLCSIQPAQQGERGTAMDSNDDVRPLMTDLAADRLDEDPTPLQPWLRRFASIVGFAGAGTAPGNPATLG